MSFMQATPELRFVRRNGDAPSRILQQKWVSVPTFTPHEYREEWRDVPCVDELGKPEKTS